MGIEEKMIITLPGVRAISWNQFYAGKHWTMRKQIADTAHWQVRAALTGEEEIIRQPVRILITGYFFDHPVDSDNVCAKIYVDALKGRIIQDDNNCYVLSTTTESRIDKENQRVEIVINEAAS